MMKDQSRFEMLSKLARTEAPPSVDVAGRVIAILSAEQMRLGRASDKPLMWLAAASSAVAVPAAVLAVIVYNDWVGPLFEISQAIAWVTQ
ncbi:MAG: hypothetical protein JSW66_09630 [Phycisphaerales bacterium]|nr:MAG: hypothetical protein JSW66_09630 [Phycisphaerales bacterium]